MGASCSAGVPPASFPLISVDAGGTPALRVAVWLLALCLLIAQAVYLEHAVAHPNLHPDCPQCLEQAALDTGMAATKIALAPPMAPADYAAPAATPGDAPERPAYRSRAPPDRAVLS